MQKNNYIKAFTLIELLVVIAIIGILASVVIASVNSAREKGRMGAAKHFSAQTDHIAGDSLVGKWDFDECSGTSPLDTSGENNNGSLTGSPAYSSSDTPMGTGCSFDIVYGQGVSIPDKYTLDLGTNSATRSFWFKTSQAGPAMFRKSDASNSGGMIVYLSTSPAGQLICYVHQTPQISVNSFSSGYNDNKWHHVACILDRNTNFLIIYVDGIFQGRTDASSLAAIDLNATSPVYFPSGYFDITMKIDGVHFFNKALTALEVGKIYVEGLKTHGLAGKNN